MSNGGKGKPRAGRNQPLKVPLSPKELEDILDQFAEEGIPVLPPIAVRGSHFDGGLGYGTGGGIRVVHKRPRD